MPGLSNISILVVEDDTGWQNIYKAILGPAGAGYSVKTADSLDEAIAHLKQGVFDVAIVDLMLPERSGTKNEAFEHGLAVLNFISEIAPKTRVLVSTGHDRTTFPVDVARGIQGKELYYKGKSTDALRESVARLALSKPLEEELWKVGGKLSRIAHDLNGGLRVILERTKTLTGAQIGHILFPVGDQLAIFVGTGQEPEGFTVPAGKSITGRVYLTGRLDNVGNVQEEDSYFPIIGDGMQSELAVPLFEGEKTIGVLNLESDRPQAFGEMQEKIATTFADLIVLTLRNEKRRQELESTDKLLSEVLNSIEEVHRSILEIGIKQLGAQTGSLLLVEENELRVEASMPENLADAPQIGMKYKIDDCVSGYAVTERRVVNVRDVTSEKPYCDVYKPLGMKMKSELVAPLEVRGVVIGALNFEHSKVGAFSEYDESLLSTLAKQASIALEKNWLMEELKRNEKTAAEDAIAAEVVHRLNSPMGAVRAWVLRAETDCSSVINSTVVF